MFIVITTVTVITTEDLLIGSLFLILSQTLYVYRKYNFDRFTFHAIGCSQF